MPIFDLILLIILAGFVFYGLFFGLIKTLGSLLGFVLGIWFTFIFYLTVFSWVKNLFFGYDSAGKIIVFIVLFTLINRLVCFIFALINNAFDLLSIIPFLKTINGLAGAILGFVLGGFILGLILMVVSRYIGNISWFGNILAESKVAPFFIKFINTLVPLLPGLLIRLKLIF